MAKPKSHNYMVRIVPLGERIRKAESRNEKTRARERVLKGKKRVNWEIARVFGFWLGFVIVLWSKKEANSSGWEPSFRGDSVPLSEGVSV